MDRWGPSVDCRGCGQAQSAIGLDENGLCDFCRQYWRVCDCGKLYERGTMCEDCIEAPMKE